MISLFNRLKQFAFVTILLVVFGHEVIGQEIVYPSNDSYTSKAESTINFGSDDKLKIKKSSTGNND